MSSGFVTETEIAEARKKRQEEWEKVRNADEPLEVPEVPYDGRSLYDRLQEQKQKKDLEYEEAHKLKNLIKGLDDDDIEFLDHVDRSKLEADRKKTVEEEKELHDYRERVANLQEKNLDQRLQAEACILKPKTVANTTRTSQVQLLKGVVVRKNAYNKRKLSEAEEDCDSISSDKHTKHDDNTTNLIASDKVEGGTESSLLSIQDTGRFERNATRGLTCIGILPGLGCYSDSSSDECSSDSDTPCEKESNT